MIAKRMKIKCSKKNVRKAGAASAVVLFLCTVLITGCGEKVEIAGVRENTTDAADTESVTTADNAGDTESEDNTTAGMETDDAMNRTADMENMANDDEAAAFTDTGNTENTAGMENMVSSLQQRSLVALDDDMTRQLTSYEEEAGFEALLLISATGYKPAYINCVTDDGGTILEVCHMNAEDASLLFYTRKARVSACITVDNIEYGEEVNVNGQPVMYEDNEEKHYALWNGSDGCFCTAEGNGMSRDSFLSLVGMLIMSEKGN